MADKEYPVPAAFQKAIDAAKKDAEFKAASKRFGSTRTEVTKFFRIENEKDLVEYTFKGYDVIFHFFRKEGAGFYSLGFETRLKRSFTQWPGRTRGVHIKFHNGPEYVSDSTGELVTLQSWSVIVSDPQPQPAESDIRTVVSRIINPR